MDRPHQTRSYMIGHAFQQQIKILGFFHFMHGSIELLHGSITGFHADDDLAFFLQRYRTA